VPPLSGWRGGGMAESLPQLAIKLKYTLCPTKRRSGRPPTYSGGTEAGATVFASGGGGAEDDGDLELDGTGEARMGDPGGDARGA